MLSGGGGLVMVLRMLGTAGTIKEYWPAHGWHGKKFSHSHGGSM